MTREHREATDPLRAALPSTVGLCPDPHCTHEFYMPDAKPGDRCPMQYGDDDECPELVVYVIAPEWEYRAVRHHRCSRYYSSEAEARSAGVFAFGPEAPFVIERRRVPGEWEALPDA